MPSAFFSPTPHPPDTHQFTPSCSAAWCQLRPPLRTQKAMPLPTCTPLPPCSSFPAPPSLKNLTPSCSMAWLQSRPSALQVHGATPACSHDSQPVRRSPLPCRPFSPPPPQSLAPFRSVAWPMCIRSALSSSAPHPPKQINSPPPAPWLAFSRSLVCRTRCCCRRRRRCRCCCCRCRRCRRCWRRRGLHCSVL